MFDHYIAEPTGEVNPHGNISSEIGKLILKGVSVEAATYATTKLFQFANNGAGTSDCDVATMFIEGGDGSTTMFVAYKATTEEGMKRFANMGKPYGGVFQDAWFDAPFYEKANPLQKIVRHSLITLTTTKPSSVISFNEIFWDNEAELLAIAKGDRNRHSQHELDKYAKELRKLLCMPRKNAAQQR